MKIHMMKKLLFAFFILVAISCTKMEAPITPTGSEQEFMGYKVDKNALAVSRQKDFGKSYWENLPVPADLFVGAFQKGVKVLTGPFGNGKYEYSSTLFAITLGDFNNDGWVDIFNAGGA